MMVRNHLPAAMQGLAVVPLFAGYDLRRSIGRLFQYDVTGGRYEERNHAATGSGSLHAGTVVKLGWREGLDRAAVLDLVISALFQAADEDSATGGPDPIRGIYPTVATITQEGFDRVHDPEIAERFEVLLDALQTEAGGSELGLGGEVAGRRPAGGAT
jgi:proteasome beta subunit